MKEKAGYANMSHLRQRNKIGKQERRKKPMPRGGFFFFFTLFI